MKTLYGKLSLVLGGVLVAIALAYLLVSQTVTRHYTEKANQQFNRDLAHNLVSDRRLVDDGRLDQQALKETFDLYMTINPSIEIYLLDLDGRIVTYSAEPGKVKRKRVSLQPIRSFLAGDPDFPLLGDDPRSHDRQKIFSVTPVPSAEQPEGYLYVVLRGEQYAAIEQLYRDSLLARLSLGTLAGSLLFGLVTGLLIFYRLTRRLRRLNHLMTGFRVSNFTRSGHYLTAPNSGDEIDQLGATFNAMAARMQLQLAELKEQDSLRRELINQVSHDLRTPLTCLHGYLETLQLKGQSFSEAERAEYLDLALGHSVRLSKLIRELFELAKLDALAVKPHPEPFSPAELLQDIGQKFQLAARQKGVQLRLSIPAQCGLANADVGLIERVLENLIANALVHTPRGGRVFLHLSGSGGKLELAVQDTGCGIAAEELPRIFDRFYRGRGGANDDGGHAGLGLAIARRIVELHDSILKVRSRPDKGTRFSFELPQWRPIQH